MATLLTPLIGVVIAAIALGEPFGVQGILALILTLGGVSLAIQQTVWSDTGGLEADQSQNVDGRTINIKYKRRGRQYSCCRIHKTLA
jgi:hypothetical protein